MNLNLKSMSRIFLRNHIINYMPSRRIREYLTVEKTRIVAHAFIDSQFSYTPLIWMLAGKTLIKKICKVHHRPLTWGVYNEYNKSYEELLQFNNNVSIHQKHLQYLPLEVLRSFMHLNPDLIWTWSYFNENPIPYYLEREPKYFYHQLNRLVLVLFLYILEELPYRITSLLQLKIIKL